MQENILTWNMTNWVTVVIMAAVGFLILAVIAQLFHKTTSTSGPGGQVAASGT